MLRQNSNPSLFKNPHIVIKNPLDNLTYYSKKFSIITKWDGGRFYTINVYDEAKKVVVDMINVEVNELNFSKSPIDQVDEVFEQVKTKYILDYERKLEG